MKAKLLILFVGITIGSVIAALYLGNKHAQEMEEEETNPDEGPLRRYREPQVTSHSIEPGEKVLVMNRDKYKKIATNYNAHVDIGSEVSPITVNDEPYLITAEQFSEDDENEKITVFYYKKEGIIVDEDEEVIEEAVEVFGKDSLDCFNIPGYEVVYVRNNKIEIDYEIVLQEGDYVKE